MAAQVLPAGYMAKPDLPNFSILGRIVFGIVAVMMVFWLLRLSGIV